MTIPQVTLATSTNVTSDVSVNETVHDPTEYDLMEDVADLILVAVHHAKVDSVCLLYRDVKPGNALE